MATPGMSRSGRVIKKSVKLLEMEDDQAKPSPSRLSISKSSLLKSSAEATVTDGDLISSLQSGSVPIVSQQAILPTTTVSPKAPSTNNNLKIKLNLSGDAIKLEPNETNKQIATLKMNLNPSATSIANASRISTPIKIISSENKTIQNAIVLKLKNDSSDAKILTPLVTAKRTLESANLSTTPDMAAKKIKIDVTKPGETTKPMITTPTIVSTAGKPTKLEFPRKIIIAQSVAAPKPEARLPFGAVLSPTRIDQPTRPRVLHPQTIVASTPKTTTAAPSKTIVAMSLSDQKRINQRARAVAQQNSPAPKATPAPSRPSVTTTTTRRSTARKDRGEDKEDQSNLPDDEKQKKKPAVSAYVLWCRESRSEMQSRYPDLNFIDLSKKMGEIWHTLAQHEKDLWFKKAKMLTNSSVDADNLYTQDWISDDLKPKTVSSKQTLPITTDTLETFDENFGNHESVGIIGTEAHSIGTELIDVQAYLNILGDSLETIGSYLQRGVKYNSDIDYSQSTALSTLLDTALVAMGSLTCLTGSLPKIAPSKEKLAKTIEDVTYFMPPTNLAYDA